MQQQNRPKRDPQKVVAIIADAGGTVVGRTRLQKIAYLLELAGLGEGFQFEYRHYGPFSENLATAARHACLLGILEEDERKASWGGSYSVYTTKCESHNGCRRALAQVAVEADSIELELAATAAFLARAGASDPWADTEKRKPDKARNGKLEKAKELYRKLAEVEAGTGLPNIR